MEAPLLVINFKTYEEGSGDSALQLAQICEKVSNQEGVEIAVAVQNADIGRISEGVTIPVLAQHIDPEGHGSNTGRDIAPTLKYNGAGGVLVNHSEDQTSIDNIEEAVKMASKSGLESIVAVDVPGMAEEVSGFGPDFIAFEPPELIGGDVSVSESKPELIEEAVSASSKRVLCGAGIKTSEDVERALQLGSEGVLVASGVVKSDDPEERLRDLVSGFE